LALLRARSSRLDDNADDASGAVQERLSYDRWGRRRNADGSDNAPCSITSATSRGFTGHEMIVATCMINMNARVYDPSLGRFASADDRPSGSGGLEHLRLRQQ